MVHINVNMLQTMLQNVEVRTKREGNRYVNVYRCVDFKGRVACLFLAGDS